MSEWISLKDNKRPDEYREFVLVGRSGDSGMVGAVMEANYIEGRFFVWRFGIKQEFVNPTHWMPLPEPPK